MSRCRVACTMRHAEWQTAAIRFDVVAFDSIDAPEPEIRWIRDAFDAGGW